MGQAQASVAQMQAYIKKVNPKVADSVIKMIPLYISEGAVEGVRGDIAFAQSCLETGNFTFSGSAVTLSQNNFCGMGVIKNGVKGNSFKTPQLGIRAQVQHPIIPKIDIFQMIQYSRQMGTCREFFLDRNQIFPGLLSSYSIHFQYSFSGLLISFERIDCILICLSG